MGSKYMVFTFHIDDGKQYFGGYQSLALALLDLWRLYRMKHFGCLYLEIR
jgi:hypothetical protein